MAEIVNLRAARKAREKAEARVKADASAAKHGRTKALKALEKARADKSSRDLEGHRRQAATPPREVPPPADLPPEPLPGEASAPQDLPPEEPLPEDLPYDDPAPEAWPAEDRRRD